MFDHDMPLVDVEATLIHKMNISDDDFGNVSNTSGVGVVGPKEGQVPQLAMLVLLLVISMSAMGNLLVCLAVIWDRRLQNMTNYFLMSLAIADLLVSLLVMPLGMVVEMYGYFPFDPELCVFWVAVDVLMCTASIWHMCTMSMDRYFTLKYPMRYGRNKTKMMVVLKIFFVWIVSFTISSPIFIYGAKDTSNMYNNGLCVPTMANFVIYGSIFAFYIPLTIMLITYILTIRILWKNQILMKNIERSNNYRPRNRYSENRCVIRTLLSPPSDEGSRKISLGNDCSDTDATMLAGILAQQENPSISRQDLTDGQDRKYDLLPTSDSNDNTKSTNKFQAFDGEANRSASMTCLEIRVSNPASDESSCQSGSNTDCSLLQSKRDRNTLHCAASFNNVPNLTSSLSSSHLSGAVQFHSCGNLTRDFKFKEWKQHYFQIQREMDQCLKDGDMSHSSPKKECSSPHKESPFSSPTHNSSRSSPVKEQAGRKSSSSQGNIPESVTDYNHHPCNPSNGNLLNGDNGYRMYNTIRSPMYDSSMDELDSSSSSELLTINLNPTSFHMYRLSVPQDATVPLLQKCNGTVVPNGHCINDPGIRRPSSDSPENVYFKRHDPSKKSIKYLLKRFNKSQGMKQILSKKATSNEKKASKVLGIIFAVFVILWTPFFTLNILSVTCSSCMLVINPQIMSVFLWMGYIASLANPIIYTMFNTAFRHTFIRILKCHLCKRGGFRMDSLPISYAASQLNNDRRNTMTVLLKDDAR